MNEEMNIFELAAMLEILAEQEMQHEEERKKREHEPLFPEWDTFPYE